MSSKNEKIPVEFSVNVVGKWKETYKWVPILGAFTAIAMAFSAGANNIPAPFSAPVGSGALTILKASIMAYSIYVPGSTLASNSSVNALFSDFLNENQPSEGFLMWSMVVVLITATIWLTIATYMELPVSTQQATQGALLGTILVTEGFDYLPMWNKNDNHNFNGGGLLWILLEWTVAPLLACICAYLLFNLLKAFILRHENPTKRILVFLPIDYGISAGLLCLFLMSQVIENHLANIPRLAAIVSVALATLIGALLSLAVVVPLAIKKLDATNNYKAAKKEASDKQKCVESQDQISETKGNDEEDVEDVLKDFMQMRVLDTVYEVEEERSCSASQSPDIIQLPEQPPPSVPDGSTPLKQLLESTPNRLVRNMNFQRIEKIRRTSETESAYKFIIRKLKKSTVSPVIEYDRHTLIRHALAEKYDDEIEDCFGFPQLLGSCIFALIQSAGEIAAVVSPYGAIVDVFEHRAKYSGNGEDVESVKVIWWFRAMGGFAAAMGFLICGRRLTQCLGGKLTYMSNSRGLASQLSTVAVVIVVSRTNLPVSSIHAFVGSLVGVGIADDVQNVNWKLLVRFLCGWLMTIIFCCGVAYVIFSASIHAPAYAVP
ncbi:hypothetical protein Ddye_024289 [Dipteronia dyeriana]|uniref:Phosphate transporter n=1 Tax=Dipteronia dyeriana TaxID=168575 RepID=A0AAD9WTF9_9ROSI|nr:hypothetical protein Ddye_024289 [Dipteronia dyeriana]